RVYWDERVCEDASLADIEEDKVRWFLKEAGHKRGLDINENKELIEMVGRGRGAHYILRMKRTISGQLEKMTIETFRKRFEIVKGED
ncbi:MAG: hypothetical protein KAT65_17095, partial [Methanophagales archaeon]|nr:hypothetical protein [Methanophagales archaeon]